ncbi:MAG: glycosyl hydrolase family 28-related protein [Dysgonomonas sp.]|nr:glycosyl hydrolase family 28-related protein [Dysgonomonas sp.]
MKLFPKFFSCILAFLLVHQSIIADNISVYQQKVNDPEASYFIPEELGIGKNEDVSDALQNMINQVKNEKNFGIVFIPEGTYRISKTIYIPKAIRLIGYGKKRPEFVLTKNSPGYQKETIKDVAKTNYMFWFVNNVVKDTSNPGDANAGTFYSAISNINLRIEEGNPYAIALRTHYAQHSFVSHVDIHIGKGRAGIHDIGNEMENVRFFGGNYGIMTSKASPGWQMMMVDTYFEGQRKAAIRTQEGGLTIVRLNAKNVPVVIDIDENYLEKLFMEDCIFENVKEKAIIVSNENNAANQISLRNIVCKNVPVLTHFRGSGKQTSGQGNLYQVKNYLHGFQMDAMDTNPEMRTISDIVPLTKMPIPSTKDIPQLPDVSTWINIKDLGAKGDGETDDTKIFLEAIEKHQNIYVPQGWYIISKPIVLKENTNLIGLNPIATQLILKESTPVFSGFGAPMGLLETPKGGKNIVNGLGLNTGAYNYRAVGCKWMAGAESYMNDVKFVGGHGSMNRGPEKPWSWPRRGISSPTNPVAEQGKDLAWDNQYWSLWVTNDGGGTFKNIWTASSYSTNGLYVSNTSTPGRIYAMSLEHHVRNEARFKNVRNWKVYAFQLEEESREGQYCQPIELENCSDMVFANLYMFQVIRVNTVYPYAIRTWNCKDIEFLNIHNYAQTKYTAALTLYDINSGIEVRPWELNRLYITGKENKANLVTNNIELLATGFEFAEGLSSDSKGNVYFCEQRMRRVYKWSAETNQISLVADFQWEPIATACDSQDNLLVIFKYTPQPGYLVDEKQESIPNLPDAGGTSFSGWGNSGFGMWAYTIDPENPEETIRLLPKAPMGSIKIHKALYPSNRWRDYHDFNTAVMYKPEECFVAPDGVTIIPCQYDLARTCALLEAYPNKPFYTSDEYDKRMVKLDVDSYGNLSNLTYFVEMGEFGSTVDKDGNLYVADGQVYIFDKDGNKTGQINSPERPLTLTFGGKDKKDLFINSYKSLYKVRTK